MTPGPVGSQPQLPYAPVVFAQLAGTAGCIPHRSGRESKCREELWPAPGVQQPLAPALARDDAKVSDSTAQALRGLPVITRNAACWCSLIDSPTNTSQACLRGCGLVWADGRDPQGPSLGSGVRSGPGHLAGSSPVIRYANDVQPQIWAWGLVSAQWPLLWQQTQGEAESDGGREGTR